MHSETTVRQNHCHQEMNTLLFMCFFLFMATQLFIGETGQETLVNGVNMLLYLVFVPGFIFLAGYRVSMAFRDPKEGGRRRLMSLAGRGFLAFFLLALAQNVVLNKLPFTYSLAQVLTGVSIPSLSAIFFSLGLLFFLAALFYENLIRISMNKRRMLAVGIFCLLTGLISMEEGYALTGVFLRCENQAAVPILPYGGFFLLGLYFEEKKPGFSWKILAGAAAVSAVSLLLYRTPVQSLVRITASALPVYLVYVFSEGLWELSLRFRPVKLWCGTVSYVFAAYGVLLFALRGMGYFENVSLWKALAVGIGVLAAVYLGSLLFVWFTRLYAAGAKYFEEKVRHKTAAYFLIYTAAFAVLLLLCFLDYLRFDRTLLWRADSVSQYYPRAVYFARYIRELVSNVLSGNFVLPMYDFSLGMGSEITYSLEPLYFLFALFGEENVEFTYSLLILIRFYLAGITSSIFFLYFKKDYFTTFIASVVYVFCGFSLFGGTRHAMFMIPMIMFPLLILAIEEIIRNKRWYLCTIFVAVSLFSNYYYLYMCTIGMGIYFLVRFFCQKDRQKKTFKNFMLKGLTISGSYLLGVAMSCIVLVTTFGMYVGSGRSGAAVIKTPSLFYYGADWLVRCLMSFLTTVNSPGDWLKLGYLPISFLALILLFVKKGRKELKILTVISVILMAIPLSGFVFSGFSSISNRWCYMMALLFAYVVAECLPQLRRMDKREILYCAAGTGIYGFLSFFGNTLTTIYTKAAFVCLAATLAVVLICHVKNVKWTEAAKKCLLLALTAALVLFNSHSLFGFSGVILEYTRPGEAQAKGENTPLRAVEQLGDESFYRSATPRLDYSTISSSMLLDYNSISIFNSTLNGAIMEYLAEMGSSSYSATQFFGMSNRTYMNALAAVKYYAYYDEPSRALPYGYEEVLKTELDGRETTVCENQYALPLGYTYSGAITREELEEYSVLERQEVMMQKAVLEENTSSQAQAFLEDETEARTTLRELEILSVEPELLEYTGTALTTELERETETEEASVQEQEEEELGNSFTIRFESLPNSETYLVLENAVLKGDMSENPINISFKTGGNNLSYKFRSDDDRYGSGQEDYVFNLGYHEGVITECTITFDRSGTIDFDSLKLYSQPMDNTEEYTEALTEDILQNVEMGTNEITGTISAGEDKLLVLSIPYQNGWTAYVDGEQVELERVNIMYMGIPLEAGEHTIRLEFEIPGVKAALVIMPASAVFFVALLVIRQFRKKKVRK